MKGLRRRLASCALALTVLQLAVLFSAPVRACCQARAAAANPAHACCVRQAEHPAGCPMHEAPAPRNECRLSCAAQSSPYFLLGAVGVLPPAAPPLAAPQSTPYRIHRTTEIRAHFQAPDAPPPRLL